MQAIITLYFRVVQETKSIFFFGKVKVRNMFVLSVVSSIRTPMLGKLKRTEIYLMQFKWEVT